MTAASPTFMGLRGQPLVTAQLLTVMVPAFVLFGYNQSNLGSLIGLADWARTFPRIALAGPAVAADPALRTEHSTVAGVVNAAFTLGALPGCLSCSWTADRLGRRPAMLAGALLTLAGEALQASAFSLAQLVVGRLVLGCGVGVLSGCVPTWQSECSPPRSRGRHVVVMGVAIGFGYLLQAWVNVGFLTAYADGPVTWRPCVALPAVFSLMLMACTLCMPESPRWLVQKDRLTEARRVLAALKGVGVDDRGVEAEISAMQLSLEEASGSSSSPSSLLGLLRASGGGEERLLYRFGICLLLNFFQQMSGGNLISVYSTVIFEQGLGLDGPTARLLSAGTLTWKFLSCFVSFFAIDRFGRRLALMVSGGGMAACMLGLAVATSFPRDNFPAQVVSVLFVFLFNFFIPIGFLGVNFLYATEVAPARLRVAMASVSTANHWLWNFVVTMITPVAINTIGYKYYIVYTCIGCCIPFSVYFLYPETMNLSLEEIDSIFRESPSAMGTVKFARQRRAELQASADQTAGEGKVVEEYQEKV